MINSTKLHLAIIILLTGLAYSNIFQNQFATDDIGYFFNWQIPKHFENIPKIFTTDSVPQDEKGVYRPVKAIAIMLTYKIWGLNVSGYHLFSLLVHLISTILVYFISLKIFLNLKSSIINHQSLAFLTSLLFGLHPIHTEAITFILASFDTVGLAFYLAAFTLYIYQDQQKNNSSRNTYYVILATMFTLLAFLTYELSLSLPLAIILYNFCFRSKSHKQFNHFKSVYHYFLLFFGYILLRFFILHIPPRQDYLASNFYKTQLVMSFAWVKYIFLLFFPAGLNLNHKIIDGVYSVVSNQWINLETIKSLSIFNTQVLINILILITLLTVAWKFIKSQPLITFSIAWFFITILPVSFLLPQSTILAERYLYLASFGYCLLLAIFINWLCENFRGLTPTISTFFILYSIFYFYQTYQRNKDWKDTETVWAKMAQQNIDNPEVFLTLGKIYQDESKFDLALLNFKKQISTSPQNTEAIKRYNNIANKYTSISGISFFYPKDWNIEETNSLIVIKTPNSAEVSIKLLKVPPGKIQDLMDGFENRKENGTSLINQGLAKIPNFDTSFVRIWQQNDILYHQFLLIKGEKVINIAVKPWDENLKEQLDTLLGTIMLN